ncbi:MAG: DEAD/DEAH box helicase [Acetatifactor sp.]|nr:DEAD/DEAH box helicase [Acetatifactor sp.]
MTEQYKSEIDNVTDEMMNAEEEGALEAEESELWEEMIDEKILRAVKEMGFTKFSPIQELAIPALLSGEDIIGQAQTGTGKTAAFGIPVLQKIDPDVKKLQSIILCPTRELAIQAAEELRKIAKYMHGIKVLPVYGGQEISRQIIGLKGVQIIVGTPGRVMDHMRRHTIKLDNIHTVVLDEADEMLNMGFREDMELILGQIPNEHQTALFSATMPQPILDITSQFQKDPRLLRVAAKELTIPLVSQRYYRVKNQDKDAACIRLLEYYQPSLCLIFCNTKVKVDELAEVLKKAGFRAEGLHGDMSQHQRDVAMNRFRNGSCHILIATDVAARGIDVDNVEAVINYDIPQDIEYYVHRIGRTGRAGKTGRSFTFVSNREMFRIHEIEKVCHTEIKEKKIPGAAKALKSKADKYLNKAWELHEHEDIELMKTFLQRKMEECECDALELAAVMLKSQVGDKGPEIEADKPAPRERLFGRFGDRREGERRPFRGRREEGEERSRRRRPEEGSRPAKEGAAEKTDDKKRKKQRHWEEAVDGVKFAKKANREDRPRREEGRKHEDRLRREEGRMREEGRKHEQKRDFDRKPRDLRRDGGVAYAKPKRRHDHSADQ